MPDSTPPFTKPELIAAFHQRATGDDIFWCNFSPDAFLERPDDRSWSPAQNVAHLTSATKPVVMALRLPRFLPRLLFGKSNAPSRHYENIVQLYHDILAGGAQASGKYAPKPVSMPSDPVNYQRTGVATLTATIQSLAKALEPWSEQDLDRLQLPHPLLGKLTIREMLFFTLYHLGHHKDKVANKTSKGVSS
ncbi:MAG: DinB family protein [Gemmatales bacterium]